MRRVVPGLHFPTLVSILHSPDTLKNWQGFTRFKKGFGGKEVEYPLTKTKFYFFNFNFVLLFRFRGIKLH
jgi:hypothetical protein